MQNPQQPGAPPDTSTGFRENVLFAYAVLHLYFKHGGLVRPFLELYSVYEPWIFNTYIHL